MAANMATKLPRVVSRIPCSTASLYCSARKLTPIQYDRYTRLYDFSAGHGACPFRRAHVDA